MIFVSRCDNAAGLAQRAAAGAGFGSLHLSDAAGKPPRHRASSPHNERLPATDAARILIVEDVLFVAWDLESQLRDLGFEICGLAANGQEAIEQAHNLAPNVLLVDINLGEEIDGIEAASRVCATQDAAVVFVTAYSDAANLERIEQAFPGAPVLTKPVTRDRLRAAVIGARKFGPGRSPSPARA